MAEENEQGSPELLAEAKTMGWVDRDLFKGNPDHWVPAQEFVEKGRQILPIVNAHNEKLRAELNRTNAQVTSVVTALQAANATIAALEETAAADVKEQVEEARKNLKAELEAASREGDHAGVADLTYKLTQLNQAEATAPAKPAKPADHTRPELAPEIKDWYAANQDFTQNRRVVSLAGGIAVELREKGETATGAAFMDLVKEEAFKALGLTPAGKPNKTEAGNGGHARGQPQLGTKTYADLPAEAKAACDKAGKRLIGANRAHKDESSWRASYVRQYFAQG